MPQGFKIAEGQDEAHVETVIKLFGIGWAVMRGLVKKVV